ncbi:N-formylglutamate amidohydrolase [Oceanicola granulosus HTCC2516]|uniref:N-formylglutamate amidohydrolase n=1 Tax=Oceanicola granulosus (strain ATCC BAA-861 / DSM 15982 / KCTC 12143 / HTCC2516) TaxID=314256 RepID=Q2CEU7_OCEGH|nr:N-formylglutamate amidohydrolase [Oceanicola granulosus]EAR51161.1 N-formylglutamate amidohydrolase [Oceanicola granulosus HTCC2516]
MSEEAGTTPGRTLLDPRRDPAPVEIVEPTRRDDILLVCEHAGRAVPAALAGLGLPEAAFERHIASDIGAEEVARAMARELGCGLVVQRYSRLVIDCNRPPHTPQSVPEVSDGTPVPGNTGLSHAQVEARVAEIFAPYAAACTERAGRPGMRAAYSIHSFEPVLAGRPRPWHAGFLYASEQSGGAALAERMRRARLDLTIGDNEPYQIEDATDWFIPACAEPHGLRNSLIEIRNDLLSTPDACRAWAADLVALLRDAVPAP